MVSKQFSASKIIAAAKGNKMLTPTQSGKDAYDSIINRYGTIHVTKKYYHRGNGYWAVYSPKKDAAIISKGGKNGMVKVKGRGSTAKLEKYAKSGTQHMHDTDKKTRITIRTGKGEGKKVSGYI